MEKDIGILPYPVLSPVDQAVNHFRDTRARERLSRRQKREIS